MQLEEGNKMNWDKVEENASKHFGDKSNDIVKVKQECVEECKNLNCFFYNNHIKPIKLYV